MQETNKLADSLDPRQMALKAESSMTAKAKKQHSKAFLLAVLAGVCIGLGFVYCAIANVTGAGKIVGGLVFSLGLMLVVILGADLFTSTTMTLIAKASKKITWNELFANWGVVYVGNFIGSMILVGIIYMSGHCQDNNWLVGTWYLTTTEHKLTHTFTEAVGLGILCNIMVCLGVWMSYAGRSVVDKLLVCLFPVGLFIACGFEHSIANMFMIPSGLFLSYVAPPEVLAKLHSPELVGEIFTWGNFVIKNLIPVTIGNIIGGGLMIGLFHWLIYLRPDAREE